MFEKDTLRKIRNKNLSDILQVLRYKGACSLSEMTDEVDGGLTTVKKCIAQAIEYGMVIEGDTAESTGGRKARQFLINKDYQYYFIAVVDNNNLIIKIYDFAINCVEDYQKSFDMNLFYPTLCNEIELQAKKYSIGTIGLSLPCVVKNGVVLDWYYNRTIVGFNIQKDLEEKYKLNVVIQNDMKLTALGVYQRAEFDSNNIVTTQFGHNGIGMAGIVNSHLIEGSNGFAGEVGYINDISKNIMGVSYPAKLIRNAIVFLNPEIIVFYKSDRQNNFGKIFDTAVKGLPKYAIPKYIVRDNYIDDIILGLAHLINKNGFYKIAKDNEDEEKERREIEELNKLAQETEVK